MLPHELEIKKRELDELEKKLELVDICNPSRAEKVKKRLYKKLINNHKKKIDDFMGVGKQETFEW